MSETATSFRSNVSTGFSFQRAEWTSARLIGENILELAIDDDAIRRAEIAHSMPTSQELDLLVGEPPREWLDEQSWRQ